MTRKLLHTISDLTVNLSYMYEGNNLIAMKCDVCGKFIAKSYDRFYCPHCHTSFLEWASYEVQKEGDELLDILKNMGTL